MSSGPYPPPAQPGFATTRQDLNSIPVADVVSGPVSGGPPPAANQAAVPEAQMAYTVQGHARRPPQEPVIVLDPQLAAYLAMQQAQQDGAGGPIPPPPPDYLPLAVCSCLCCWPVAFIAVYNSRLVRFFYQRGQFAHALAASRRAKQMSVLAILTGIILMVVYWLSMRERQKAAQGV